MLKVIISPAKKMKIRNDILPYKNIPFFIKEAEKLLVVTTKKFNTLKKIDLIICLPFPFLFLFKKIFSVEVILC